MDPITSGPAIDLKGRKVLVIDDDRLNLRIVAGILRKEGYELAEGDSGEKALELYETFHPDLMLLDVMLPGIDGFETCRTLKKKHGEACSPIIFITAKNEAEDVVQGLDAGGVDYLSKPFRGKEVAARVRAHLTNKILVEQQQVLVDQLSKADASKNRFLGMCAHDLRNPLASIRGLAELMRDGVVGQLTAEQLDLLNTIHAASQSMLVMVNELLDVATIESGELKIEPSPTRILEIIEKSVYLANVDSVKKNTRVEIAPTSLDPVLSIDANKIKQVVDNLISNAVKYSPPGSLITVELHADEKHSGFSVKDQGPGIPDNERDKLFKDFGRLSAKPTGGEKSVGLGLAIVRKIVEAHGGTVIAQNLPAKGCEFRVELPLTP